MKEAIREGIQYEDLSLCLVGSVAATATPLATERLFRLQDTEDICKKSAKRHLAKDIPSKRAGEKAGKIKRDNVQEN